MTPIDNFLNWLKYQDKEIAERTAYEILLITPDFTIKKENINTVNELKNYLLSEASFYKIAGKALFIQNTMDFVIDEYDNIDGFLAVRSFVNGAIEETYLNDQQKDLLRHFQKKKDNSLGQEKEFKSNWAAYKHDYFNNKTIREYYLASLLNETISHL